MPLDIRTKLIIALVAVSLGSMALLGYFAFVTSAGLLKEISGRQLDALAESKARDVRKLVQSWQDRVSLVASRTQLRINLNRYNETPSVELKESIQRILDDAQRSTPSIMGLALFDLDGALLCVSGLASDVVQPSIGLDQPSYLGFHSEAQQPVVSFAASLKLRGKPVGSIGVLLDGTTLSTVTGDYTGLGQYGESILVVQEHTQAARSMPAETEQGKAEQATVNQLPATQSELRILHPLRDNSVPAASYEVLTAAAAGVEARFMREHIDYRGKPVWAATRSIDELDWGLVVQLDREEELLRTNELRDLLIDLGLSLSAFAIIAGVVLGYFLARPIRKLAQTVQQIRAGDESLRAEVETEDEVGELAQALNEFLARGGGRE
ncbi:MAG: HAMP domain-containing protein [Pseudomonadales bacterium]